MIKGINTLQPYLKIYPPDNQVFAEPFIRYARHLLPLVSIDLSVINPAWQGWIHLVNTVEPEEGYVGQYTQAFHNYYLRENWIGFQINNEGHYELLGDFRYFYLENSSEALPDSYPNHRLAVEENYAVQHEAIKESKVRFAKYGKLYAPNEYTPKDQNFCQEEPRNLISQLGGGVGEGNWASDFPLDTSDENNIRPLTPDGKCFYFIASVTGYDYCAVGADKILLFYEPTSKIALLTFDWS